MTGTFDNWQKTVKLEKHVDAFSKTVDLPLEKILYKVRTCLQLLHLCLLYDLLFSK